MFRLVNCASLRARRLKAGGASDGGARDGDRTAEHVATKTVGAQGPAVSHGHRDTIVDVGGSRDDPWSARRVTVDDGVHVRPVHCLSFFQEADEAVESMAVSGEKIGRPVFSLSQ